MSAAEKVLASLSSRGLKLKLYEPRDLVLIAPKSKSDEATERLREAVKMFAEEIIASLALTPIPRPGKPPVKEEPPAIPHQRLSLQVPPGAKLFIADKDAHCNKHRRGEPYMWTWEGAATWYYVAQHPIPMVVQVA